MTDLISRQAAIDAIVGLTVRDREGVRERAEQDPDEWIGGINDAITAVEELPTIDVPDRKVGKWMPYEFGDYRWHKCSVCGKADKYIDTIIRGYALGTNDIQKNDLESVRNYCPNCGAQMERSEE